MQNSGNCPSCGAKLTPNTPYCPKCLIIVDQKILDKKLDIASLQNHFGAGVDLTHIAQASTKFFHSNEKLIAAFSGSDPGLGFFKQYLIITNLRVIFWKRGITEVNKSFNFEDIGSVGEMSSILSNGLELNIKGAKEYFPYMVGSELPLAISIIRDKIQQSKNKTQTVILQESIPDQIKKLADLRDQGILTEIEFQSKKTELLKRL